MECGVCYEKFVEAGRPLCLLHPEFCSKCEQDYVRHALGDRFQFPLRCMDLNCRTIVSVRAVADAGILDKEEMRKLKRFSKEASGGCLRYCPDPTCASGVSEDMIEGSSAHCPKCRHNFCIHCLDIAHDGECVDPIFRSKGLVTSELVHGCRICPCGATLERSEGCNSIVCICSRKLCYLCGEVIPSGAHACPQGCELVTENSHEGQQDLNLDATSFSHGISDFFLNLLSSLGSFAQHSSGNHWDDSGVDM